MAEVKLTELGLTNESSFDEIQEKLNGLKLFSEQEVQAERDTAAKGARLAALDKAKKFQNKNVLSDEEMKEFKNYKKQDKFNTLKNHDKLKGFNDADLELLATSSKYNLLELDDEELEEAIEKVSIEEAHRKENDIPPLVDDPIVNDDFEELSTGVK